MLERIIHLVSNIPTWVFLAVIIHLTVLGAVAYLILLERKTASWVQDRLGPNRVGFHFNLDFLPKFHFWGLGQPLADGLKFLVKEDFQPRKVDTILFTAAPIVMIIVVIISIAVIPWGGVKQSTDLIYIPVAQAQALALAETVEDRARIVTPYLTHTAAVVHAEVLEGELVYDQFPPTSDPRSLLDAGPPGATLPVAVTYQYPFQIAKLNIGVLFVLAVLSLAVYGVVIGGWASNNKYSFIGGLRACANMISYEIPLGLSVLAVVLMFGTLDLGEIVNLQAGYWLGFIPAWNVFTQPVAFILFLICIHAEANRAPFDMAEAEQELVGGYHTEYSSMRFALFFLAEYAGMVTTSCVAVALFFGGWHLPGVDWLYAKITGAFVAGAVTDSLVLNIIRTAVFFGKAVVILFIFMWVRWSLPRFRFDQLMQIAWGGMIPLSIALVAGSAICVYLTGGATRYPDVVDQTLVRPFGFDIAMVFLLMNGIIVVGSLVVMYLLPAGPSGNNQKIDVPDSRFKFTPGPGKGRGAIPARPATVGP